MMSLAKILLVALSLGYFCGCGSDAKEEYVSDECRALSRQISENVSAKLIPDEKFSAKVISICTDIGSLTNREEKVLLLRSISHALKRDPDAPYTDRERDDLTRAFLAPHENIAYHMVEAGFDLPEGEDFLLGEFRKFRKLCHPSSEATGNQSTDQVAIRQREHMIKNLDWQWRNTASFFERISIRTIFYSASPETRARFLQRWHEEFGCFDSKHKGE